MSNLNENLNNVYARVKTACERAGRNPSEVTVLAVSKRHPVESIRALHGLGQVSFGENYVNEAVGKMDQLVDLAIEWHYVGPMQSNKTRTAAGRFHWVQSADREKILRRLSEQRPLEKPPLNVCIQVNIDGEPQKAGALPQNVLTLVRLARTLPGLHLRGLMTIPRIGTARHDPVGSYHRMQDLYEDLCARGFEMDTLSMGMSADLETAIMHGSTMVRIGTGLFGPRP